MDLAKDAFIILFCLAGSDGNLDKREQEIIFDFLNSQTACLGQIDFDPQQVYSELAAQSVEGQIEAFSNALQNFKTHSSEPVRSAMLDAAAEVAAADGAITDGEKRLFQTMALVWEIDLQEFFQRHGVSVAPQPTAPTANSPTEKVEQANFHAWSLGSVLFSFYAKSAKSLNPSLSELSFESVKKYAEKLGLTINPLTGLTGDDRSDYVKIIEYFNEESPQISEEIKARYGETAMSHYRIIAFCHILLLYYKHEPEPKAQAQMLLDSIASLKSRSAIPDAYFQPIVSAFRQRVGFKALETVVFDFDVSVNILLSKQVETSTSVFADAPSKRTNQASVFSWTLGGALANYSLNASLLQPEKSAADFDKAEMSAEVLGLTIRPISGGFDPLMIDFNSLAYLQKSLNIADDIKVRFGVAAASYFEIIVQCYLPLLLQNSASENRTFSQTALEKILSLKAYAPIPDEYFQPLIAAARQAVGVEDLKRTVFDFDRRVYEFLCARLRA